MPQYSFLETLHQPLWPAPDSLMERVLQRVGPHLLAPAGVSVWGSSTASAGRICVNNTPALAPAPCERRKLLVLLLASDCRPGLLLPVLVHPNSTHSHIHPPPHTQDIITQQHARMTRMAFLLQRVSVSPIAAQELREVVAEYAAVMMTPLLLDKSEQHVPLTKYTVTCLEPSDFNARMDEVCTRAYRLHSRAPPRVLAAHALCWLRALVLKRRI